MLGALDMTNALDLNEAFDLLLRSHVGGRKAFQLGNSTFEATPARFTQLNAPGYDERNTIEFAVLASVRAGRFTSLANINPFETPKAAPCLKLPIFYLYTDDERRTFTIAGVGGEKDVMRFKADNGSEALLPVVLVVEHNQQLVRAADFSEDLFSKLNRGLAAHGEKDGLFVEGKSFEAVRTPNSLFGVEAEAEMEFTASRF
jgi:hypothetical protein